MTSKNNSEIFDVIFLIILSIVIIFLLSSFYKYREVCLDDKTVLKVGACSSEGRCSVRYTDGSIDEEYLPIAGKKICKKYIRVFWWGSF